MELLTVPQARAIIKQGRSTLYRHICARDLPVVRLGRRSIRIPADELYAFIARQSAGADGQRHEGRACACVPRRPVGARRSTRSSSSRRTARSCSCTRTACIATSSYALVSQH